MQQYVVRFKNNLEAQYNKKICTYAYTLLAIASAIGTIDIERIDDVSIFERNITPIKDELNYDVDVNKLKMFLSLLCEKDKADLNVYSMFPDLVGEFFFIETFNRISSKYKHEWYKIFCSEKYQNYFCSFLIRCLCDWYSLKTFQNIIKDLFEFAVTQNYKNFIELCINNYFLVSLSYYYTLTDNNFVWIKDEILSKYDTTPIAEQYAMMLVNISAGMSKADDILEIAKRIKDEVLNEYGTAKIAEPYARALVNATTEMSKADDRLKIASRIKDEVLSEYCTETATQRQFGITGDMYIGDEAQDFMLSHKIKYGTGQTVIVNYVFFNMLTGKGEKGKATVAVNSDGSGNSGDNAGIDIQLSKVGDAPTEFTYTGTAAAANPASTANIEKPVTDEGTEPTDEGENV